MNLNTAGHCFWRVPLVNKSHNSPKTVAADLFDQPFEVIHATMGNDPNQWLLHADALLVAAEIVYTKIGKPPASTHGIEAAWGWFSVHDVARMLRGMALECLLKAAWLHCGERLFDKNRFVGIQGKQGHDLYGIYTEVCKKRPIALNMQEKKLLARFAFAIVMARYPVAKSSNGCHPSAPVAKTKMSWCAWSHDADTKVWRSLLRKILAAIPEAEVQERT